MRLTGLLNGPESVGAFADDIAVVIKDYRTSMTTLAVFFNEYQAVASLQLDVEKTVFIPLWPVSDAKALKVHLTECTAFWRDIAVATCGKYLGFYVGPGAGNKSWEKPLAKYDKAVSYWSALRMGMFMNVLAHNVYIVTLLEYVAQLHDVADHKVGE